jgi:hypothetical protein
MSDKQNDDVVQHYESRFAWRKERQIQNLRELSQIAESGEADPIKVLPHLVGSHASDDPKDALRWSILDLIYEATECFIFGEFQSCIITCGAVVERVFKLEYETAHGNLPKGELTLGKCMYNINWDRTRISPEILEFAKGMLEPRNSRAHALLEHSHPQLAIIGGAERGRDIQQSGHYLIEPFRGDAKKIIELTYKVLIRLYGVA